MSGGRWARVASVVALAGVLAGCGGGGGPRAVPPSNDHWLVVWAGDADRRHSDFLAIINSGGKVVRTVPVKSAGNEPQDVSNDLRRDGHVFATGALTNRTFVFDVHDPSEGKLVHIDDPGTSRPLAGPRGIANLPGGRVAIACADPTGYRGEPREVVRASGGLRVLGDDGGFVRDVPASGEASKGFIVAPAAVAVQPSLRRLVTTSEGHGFTPTAEGDLIPGISVQLWSLPGLTFEKHIVLEAGPRGDENLGPRTPVFLRRKPVLLVNTRQGGALYVSDTMDLPDPVFRLAYDFGAGSLPGGAAVTPDDRFYVTALAGTHRVVVLSLAKVLAPREVSSVRLDQVAGGGDEGRRGGPSALAMSQDGTRIAVADYTADVPGYRADGDRRVYVLRLDPGTGRLRVDNSFRDEESGAVGVDFDRAVWPHGKTGPARPHGLLFIPGS